VTGGGEKRSYAGKPAINPLKKRKEEGATSPSQVKRKREFAKRGGVGSSEKRGKRFHKEGEGKEEACLRLGRGGKGGKVF